MKTKFTIEVDGAESDAMYNIMMEYLAKNYPETDIPSNEDLTTAVQLALFVKNALQYSRIDGDFKING